MKTFTLLFIFALSAIADWSARDTTLLRVTPVPAAKTSPKGLSLVVTPRPGVVLPVGDEYRVRVAYRALNGKSYYTTRNLIPDKDGNASVFVRCDIDEPLALEVEPIFQAHIEESAEGRPRTIYNPGPIELPKQ